MKNDADHIVDDLLIRWHQWQRIPRPRGHAHRSTVVGEYQSRSEFSNDDEAGALDDALENRRMMAVDFEVREIHEPHRSAIYVLARALTHGVMVFLSPRLPADKAHRDAVLTEAKAIATRRFQSAGLL